jgi:predicted RecA/RadA family phage recombinase
MNNGISPGNTVTAVAPYAVNAGSGCALGSGLVGIAVNTYASGATGVFNIKGVFTGLVKASGAGEAWALGDPIYFATATKNFSKNSTGGIKAGFALSTVATGVLVSGEVLLEPSV